MSAALTNIRRGIENAKAADSRSEHSLAQSLGFVWVNASGERIF